jgi:hypothetical protein
VGLRSLACWDFGFESRRGHGYLSVMSVVCCQAKLSARGRSLIQSVLCLIECDLETSTVRKPRLTSGCRAINIYIYIYIYIYTHIYKHTHKHTHTHTHTHTKCFSHSRRHDTNEGTAESKNEIRMRKRGFGNTRGKDR